MKCDIRFKILLGTISLTALVIIALVLEDKCETYDPIGYLQALIPWLSGEEEWEQPAPLGGPVGDRIIVVPSLEEDDVSWVRDELADWQHAIYVVNPSTDEARANNLTTPMNKGHEAMAYLTYIIDNYEQSFPSIVLFLHSHRGGFFAGWHVDTPLHDNVYAVRHLQLDYVKEKGYVNMRCNLNPGCKKTRKANPHFKYGIWQEVMGNTSTPAFSQTGPVAAVERYESFEDELLAEFIQPRLWAPCCAQFAVSSEQIYRRPLDDYVKIRQWVIDTDKDDAASGRVLEYLWHVIFGQEAVQCPDPETCYCRVYGRC